MQELAECCAVGHRIAASSASVGYGSRTCRKIGDPDRPRLLVSPKVVLALAVFQTVLGTAVPKFGTFFGCVLTIYIVWLARPDYLPALIVNQISSENFTFGSVGSDSTLTSSTEAGTLVVAGIPFNLNYMLALGVAARITWELRANPRTYRDCRPLLGLWYLAMGLALVMSLMGRLQGGATWTLPVRTMSLCGAYFYGLILAPLWRSDARILSRQLLPSLFALLLLFHFGWLRHKVLFIIIPSTVPVVWLVWRHESAVRRSMGLICLLLAVMLGTGYGFGIEIEIGGGENSGVEADGQTFGMGGATLTQNGLLVGSILLTFVLARGALGLRRAIGRALGWPAFVFVLTASIGIAAIGPSFVSDGGFANDLSLGERIKAKLFDDRSVIWNAALTDAIRAPHVLKPSGRPLMIEHRQLGEIEWPFGAHNGVLNTLMRQRWINGPIILLLLLIVMRRGGMAFAETSSDEVAALAVIVIVTAIVGVIVNDYPLNDEGGFWFFCLGGIVAGAFPKECRSGACSDEISSAVAQRQSVYRFR